MHYASPIVFVTDLEVQRNYVLKTIEVFFKFILNL